MPDDVRINISTKNDGSGAKQAQNDVKSVGDSVEEAGGKAKKASFDFKEFATNAGLGATAILGGLAGVAAMAVKSAGEYETAQLAFKTLLGSAEAASQEIADIQKQAVETPFNLPELIKANQLLVSAGVGAKDAQEDILNLGKAVSSTGGSSSDLLRMAGNLQQIKAIGKASAQDIKQFGFAGIPIYQLLADVTGKNVDEIKEMDIGYEDLTAALSKAGQAGGRYADSFKNASESFQVKFSNLQDAIGIGMTDIANKSGLFNVVKEAISGVTTFISTQAVPAIISFTSWLSQNQTALTILGGLLLGLMVAAGIAFVVTFGPMIAAALVFAAAGAAVALAVKWVIDNFELLKPYFPFIAGALFALGVIILANVIPPFIAWAVAAASAAIATIVALLPVIAVMVVVGAAVALLALAWKNNFMGMRDVLKPIVDGILKILKPVIDFIGKIIDGIKQLAGIKGSGVNASGLTGVSAPESSTGGLSGIPNIAGLGSTFSIPGINFPISGAQQGGSAVSSGVGGQTIQQYNTINTPTDLNAMFKDLSFAVASK